MKQVKNILILKSEPLSENELIQLKEKNISVQQLNLLTFEQEIIENLDYQEYSYVVFNSPHAVQEQMKCNQYLVVGKKTQQKVQEVLESNNILVFNTQEELTNHLKLLKKCKILYAIGNLSEVDQTLQQQHDLKVVQAYQTKKKQNIKLDEIHLSELDYIVYYSHSNYQYFKELQLQLNEGIVHIFWGKKCSQSNTENKFVILEKPNFESLLKVII